jgi:hypothetical protein
MQIKKLPKQIQNKVFEKQIEQGNKPDKETYLIYSKNKGNFDFIGTEEGHDFWREIVKGNYDDFYKKYPKDKTPNWIKLLAIFSIVFIIYIVATILIKQI